MKIAIAGCLGRMGKELLSYILNNNDQKYQLVGATASPNSLSIGNDISSILNSNNNTGIIIQDSLENFSKNCDAIIDFTTPDYSCEISNFCTQNKIIHICGTTGFSEDQYHLIKVNAKIAPTFHSANMCFGVNLLTYLIKEATNWLPLAQYDIDITEIHHKNKIDAPSGTALMIANEISNAYGINMHHYNCLENKGKRPDNAIGISASRRGKEIGTHSIYFSSNKDTIKLEHASHSRQIYAEGAFYACEWMKNKSAGKVYCFNDLFESYHNKNV